jgi:histidinol phosphatase-like PHP family hydrolase
MEHKAMLDKQGQSKIHKHITKTNLEVANRTKVVRGAEANRNAGGHLKQHKKG